MDYKLLKEIFYSDAENYQTEYLNRFNSPSAIKFNIRINNNTAFLMITPELFNKLYQISCLNDKLNNTISNLPTIALDQYIKRCLIDEIVLTNEIEGVISTKKDIFEILESAKLQDKHKRLLGLVTKYSKLTSNENLSIASCQDVREIYDDLVLQEVLNDNPQNAPDGIYFRKSGVNILSKYSKVIHTGVMPENTLNNTMTAALSILNDSSLNIIIRIAVFHYFFGYIHPFYDGNGRTSRFISSYLLSKNLNVLSGYRLAYTIKENINVYYNSFKITNDEKNKGDLTPFVINFFDILIKLLDKLIYSITKRHEQLKYYSGISHKLFNGNDKYANIAFILFQQTLFGTGGISAEELVKASNSSEYTVRKCISELNAKKLLIVSKISKRYLYSFDINKFEK